MLLIEFDDSGTGRNHQIQQSAEILNREHLYITPYTANSVNTEVWEFFFTYIFCVQFNFLAEKQGLQIPNLISVPQSTFADSALIHHQSDWPLIGVEMDAGSTTADLLKEKFEPK